MRASWPVATIVRMNEVTQILAAIESGDLHTTETLFPLVYDELRPQHRLFGIEYHCFRCKGSHEGRFLIVASNLKANSLDAVFTDPPYFDNVQYAELMDFCDVWLRRLLTDVP